MGLVGTAHAQPTLDTRKRLVSCQMIKYVIPAPGAGLENDSKQKTRQTTRFFISTLLDLSSSGQPLHPLSAVP